MYKLNDKRIRTSLIKKLKKQSTKPKAVIEELRVHNGNAIADVVALYNEAHCFEIKGDTDKVERISEQGYYYDTSFRKITLVTTQKHLRKALLLAPSYWGIMVAGFKNREVVLKYVRGAKRNFNFNKQLALLTLWKSEMLLLTEDESANKSGINRNKLAEIISNCEEKEKLSKLISTQLLIRHQNTFISSY
ncbi:MAG: sce7726 family protein [Deltaproteobacteria bacterium]|nr:sce7726 family protein [Deltaproteobacteria bacterium]MBT6500872.1 sce7726 family protein [Deltaproteobacteria bacterium]MBT7711235.1 sce7726 family protein [Deltaproteobacteria bacterium]